MDMKGISHGVLCSTSGDFSSVGPFFESQKITPSLSTR